MSNTGKMKGTFLMNLLSIGTWLGVLSTWPLLHLISPMLFIRSVNLCLLLDISILLQFTTSFAIFEDHLLVGCFFLPTPLFNLLPIVMLIGLGVRIHVDLLQVGVCF